MQGAPCTATESFFRKNGTKVVQGSHLRCEISVSPRRERSELMFVQWCRTICVDDCSTFSLKSSTTLSNGVVFHKKTSKSGPGVALAMRNFSFVYTTKASCASFTMVSSKNRKQKGPDRITTTKGPICKVIELSRRNARKSENQAPDCSPRGGPRLGRVNNNIH